jgi:hypothetical protein
MAFVTPDVQMQESPPEAMRMEGSSIASIAAVTTSEDPLAMPTAVPQTPSIVRQRGFAKCTSCTRAKKSRYKVIPTVVSGISLTGSVLLILLTPTDPAWIANVGVGITSKVAIRSLAFPYPIIRPQRSTECGTKLTT